MKRPRRRKEAYAVFIVSMKVNKKKALVGLLVAAVLVGGIIFTASGRSKIVAVDVPQENISISGANNEERLEFIRSFGWETPDEPSEIVEMYIPNPLNDEYVEYNKTQTEQGYDFEKFKGQRVKRYQYEITNYPTGAKNVKLTLYIFKDKIIGGDVALPGEKGFIHGFERPEYSAAESRPEQPANIQQEDWPID